MPFDSIVSCELQHEEVEELTMIFLFLLSLFHSTSFILYTDGYADGDVRLVNGPSPLMGRVEIFHNDQWGTVCDDYWDDKDATVICRQLGLSGVGTARCCASFGGGAGYTWLDDVACNGTESSVSACTHEGFGNEDCTHSEDAGVICGDIRLTGTAGTDGRVEIHHQDEWIQVLDESWDAKGAAVVCRQMGIPQSLARASTTYYGRWSESVTVCNVQCDGTEDSLVGCGNAGWGTKECIQSRVANVACDRILRLFSETGQPDAGVIEIYSAAGWGSICDDHWDDADATVVCRELGIGAVGRAVHESLLGKGSSGNIWLDNVNCKGNESSIFDCEHRGLGFHDCERSEIAGVVCSNASKNRYPGALQTQIPTTETETFSQLRRYTEAIEWPIITGGITVMMCFGLLLAVVYLAYVIKHKLRPGVHDQPLRIPSSHSQNSYAGPGKQMRSDGTSEEIYMNDRKAASHRGHTGTTADDAYDEYYLRPDVCVPNWTQRGHFSVTAQP